MQKNLHWCCLLLFMVIAAGCHKGGGDSHDHGHGHDPAAGQDHAHEAKTAQITVWTDRYEVFAEHTAPVVNQLTRFITHVTDLHTLKPRTEGMVKFVLRQAEETFEHPQAAPERPGIYIPAISFPKAGGWQATLLIPTDGTNAAVELGTIEVHPDEHSAAHADFPEAPEGISFLKEQQWKILTRIEPVTKRRLVERVKLPATTMAKPGLSASVIAPVAGQLLAPAAGRLPLPGQKVEAGQLLALLRPSFSEAAVRFAGSEGEFARAKAAFEKAELNFDRIRGLAEQQAKSQRELQEAELALQTARAGYEAAGALRSTYRQLSGAEAGASPSPPDSFSALELRAPIAGIINHLGAGLGEPMPADHIVFQILNPEVLWIEARVPEAALLRIPEEADASFTTAGGSEFVSIKGTGGGRVFAGLQVDRATRTVPLVYELQNSALGLRIGQALNLYVETSRLEDTLALPDSAIVEEAGNFVAFVQLSGETFEKRELKLGIRDGNFVQVLDGVGEGERVVTKGAMAIRLASVSGVIPAHGHAH